MVVVGLVDIDLNISDLGEGGDSCSDDSLMVMVVDLEDVKRKRRKSDGGR